MTDSSGLERKLGIGLGSCEEISRYRSAKELTTSCGWVMCLSAMVMDSALWVVVRWPLKALNSRQMSPSGVNRLNVLIKLDQDSFLAVLMVLRHSALARL